MNCPQCNEKINDNVLICPHCKARVAEDLAKNELELAKKNAIDSVGAMFHSPLQLIVTIAITLIALASLLSIIPGGIGYIMIPATVFEILTAVTAWKVYTQKGALDPANVRKMQRYPKAMQVYSVISTVLIGIVCGIVFIVMCFVKSALGKVAGWLGDAADFIGAGGDLVGVDGAGDGVDFLSNLVSGSAAFIFILGCGVIVLVMWLAITYAKAWKHTSDHYVLLAGRLASRSSGMIGVSSVKMWYVAVLSLLCGLMMVMASPAIGVGCIGAAIYLICNDFLFRAIEKKYAVGMEQVRAAQDKLTKATNDTKKEIARQREAIEAERRELQLKAEQEQRRLEAEKQRKEEARREQEAEQQRQQQQMFQNMMAQMMAQSMAQSMNNMNNAPAQPAAPQPSNPPAPADEEAK